MPAQVFINLAVSNLEQSAALYSQMGFNINPAFSDDSAKCMVWSDTIFLMIMTKERFQAFATKPLADTKAGLAGIFALSTDSTEAMHSIADKALKAGATEPKPLQDHGFMQLRTIEDMDGHTWEIFFMDLSQMPQQ